MEAQGNIKEPEMDVTYICTFDDIGLCVNPILSGRCIVYKLSDIDEMIAWSEKRHAERESMKEYITTTDIDLLSLAETGIDPAIFLALFRSEEDICASKGNVINENSTLYAFRSELLSIGVIKEDVCDPVVEKGSTFMGKHWPCAVVQVSAAKYQLIDIEGCNREDDIIIDSNNGPMHLSDFVGKERVGQFRPCNIKTTEVK